MSQEQLCSFHSSMQGLSIMENVGVLVVSYGSREAAIVDALSRSQGYDVEIYVADKQRNPFNIKRAAEHIVIPDLSIELIGRFAEANRERIDFGIVGPEKPIIEGVRDLVEKKTGIPFICPTQEYAIEGSKVMQRLLFDEVVPENNPRFKVFDPRIGENVAQTKKNVYKWLDELDNQAVVKPDKPTAGKGVGVWGDHFSDREQLFEHFLSNYQYGPVIIEEKIEGEESSFQAFCDGEHLVPLPETRDYKRAFDEDRGPNTGGMGSYKDIGDILPFMSNDDRARELKIVGRIFDKWKQKANDNTVLRGVPLYMAFMHTGSGLKILENNSRPGDPEIINILPILKDDFVDICYWMLEGNLNRIEVRDLASVVTYKVPPSYGGFNDVFPDKVEMNLAGTPVDLTKAFELASKQDDLMRIYPGAMELRGNQTYALKSRAVGVVGFGSSIEEARQISLKGASAIVGGQLWNRTDVASLSHIERSMRHMQKLRLAE
jgi:phosphoribosylamine--glycine ligase